MFTIKFKKVSVIVYRCSSWHFIVNFNLHKFKADQTLSVSSLGLNRETDWKFKQMFFMQCTFFALHLHSCHSFLSLRRHPVAAICLKAAEPNGGLRGTGPTSLIRRRRKTKPCWDLICLQITSKDNRRRQNHMRTLLTEAFSPYLRSRFIPPLYLHGDDTAGSERLNQKPPG